MFWSFVSISSVKFTLNIIQKICPIRQCENTYYKSRIRPCLQYQIKCCLAPCVGLVTNEQYDEQINMLKKFLAGKFNSVLKDISQKMHQASEEMGYENTQVYGDQLIVLRKLQEQRIVDIQADKTFDAKGRDETAIMQAFLSHFYLGDEIRNIWPKNIILYSTPISQTTFSNI